MNKSLDISFIEEGLPRLDIRIAVFGAVSTGKSTFINGILSKQYSDMKIKRTTMLPQVYFEVNSKK